MSLEQADLSPALVVHVTPPAVHANGVVESASQAAAPDNSSLSVDSASKKKTSGKRPRGRPPLGKGKTKSKEASAKKQKKATAGPKKKRLVGKLGSAAARLTQKKMDRLAQAVWAKGMTAGGLLAMQTFITQETYDLVFAAARKAAARGKKTITASLCAEAARECGLPIVLGVFRTPRTAASKKKTAAAATATAGEKATDKSEMETQS